MSRYPLVGVLACAATLAALSSCSALAADPTLIEKNMKTVIAFEDATLNQKNFDELSKYIGSRYTQHNPTAADGPEGLKDFIAFLKEKFPQNHAEHIRVLADGDYVVVHDHAVREYYKQQFGLLPSQTQQVT
jgi:predicted SnoaL-like aldol condensation-catalyzing enzyme